MQADLTRLGSSSPLESRKQTWVQTERSVHEAWAALCSTKPRAAALLHTMVAHMDSRAAIVASRETLAELANCSVATIKRSVADLKEGKWIQVVQVGGKGGVNAYAINSRVAWGDERKHLPFAAFTATVLASRKEQEPQDLIESAPLRRLPTCTVENASSRPVTVAHRPYSRNCQGWRTMCPQSRKRQTPRPTRSPQCRWMKPRKHVGCGTYRPHIRHRLYRLDGIYSLYRMYRQASVACAPSAFSPASLPGLQPR